MKAYFVNNESRTIQDIDGRTLYFGLQDFLDKIVKGDCCFICGSSPDTKIFNDEHVIPDWILKKHNLHSKRTTLPNGAATIYGSYKIPCCQECNSQLGKEVEEPISKLLNKSYTEIISHINSNPSIVHDIFRWLCLIYLKTHLKDRSFKNELDRRLDSGTIADYHDWEEIHHIHTIARAHYTNAFIDLKVYGTIFIVPVLLEKDETTFDYFDSRTGQVVALQLEDFCIIACLNDSCAGYNYFLPKFEKISGPLTRIQIREIASHLYYINFYLEHRPQFYSTIGDNGYEINVELPEKLELHKEQKTLPFGEIIYGFASQILPFDQLGQEFAEKVKTGRWTWLFNEIGEFIDNRKNIPSNNWNKTNQ